MEEALIELGASASQTVINLLIFAIGAALASLIGYVIFKGVQLVLNKIPEASAGLINNKFRNALQLLLVVIGLNASIPFTSLTGITEIYLQKIFYIALVLSFALLLIKVTEFIKSLLYIKFDVSEKDNLDERKARTQIEFLQKLASVIILFIAIAIVLMSFDRVKELGTSILASAGIAGLIIGFAAQKSISNLLAGFQIAFTQPIRMDDVVVVENEWGRIEEITLTYVVVKIWDQRRLILPISYFIEKPFQNWTRVSADILGTIYIYTDYTVPVNALRQELTRIVSTEGKKWWDGKVAIVQVTDATEKCVQLRALISSANSGDAWDLRCLVREKLIDFLNVNYPDALPKNRSEWMEMSGPMK